MQTYTQEQVEEIKQELMKEKYMQFAKKLENMVSNNYVISQKKNLFSNKFTAENIQQYLESPQKYEKELRLLSLVLTTLSPQYQQIINYLPSISKFVPVVIPNLEKFSNAKGVVADTEKIRKDYLKVSSNIDKLNIPHEFQKIMSVIVRDDIFYGYIHETNDSFYIQQLDSDYCRISTISDGCYNLAFDFSFFKKNNTIKGIEGELVEYYPPEFKTKYNAYLKDTSNMQWQELDENYTIVIKFNETLPFSFPPYANLFSDLSDLKVYRELSKSKTETENYKFIGMKLPLNNKGDKEDDFLVTTETAMAFYQMLLSNLPDGIGAFLSATDFEAINFGSSNAQSKNLVDEALDNVFSSSGISAVNFGKGANNSSGIAASNNIDSSLVFRVYRQFERWLNRKIKREYNGKFSVKLMDVSSHNLKESIDNYLKLSQFGVPVKLYLSALSGVSQNAERGLSFLEDSVLDLSNQWKPLQSSHTSTATDSSEEVGRPTVADDQITDNGEANRNNNPDA